MIDAQIPPRSIIVNTNVQKAPAALAEAVSRELVGERVLWAGSPDRWRYASKHWATAAFGVPFVAFAIFWTYQAAHVPAKAEATRFSVFFPLWGLMFVGFGLSMLLSPLWAAWVARNVYYVVTDRRAIIFEKQLRLKVSSFARESVAGFERVSNGGASGNIIFQRLTTGSGRGARTKEIGFIGLPDFTGAEKALNELRASVAD